MDLREVGDRGDAVIVQFPEGMPDAPTWERLRAKVIEREGANAPVIVRVRKPPEELSR